MELVAMPRPSYQPCDQIVDRLTKEAEKPSPESVTVEPSGGVAVGAVSRSASPAAATPSRAEVEPLKEDQQNKIMKATTKVAEVLYYNSASPAGAEPQQLRGGVKRPRAKSPTKWDNIKESPLERLKVMQAALVEHGIRAMEELQQFKACQMNLISE